MKIRLKGNSIRYRLTRSEVESFAKAGYIEQSTNFNLQPLFYALEVTLKDQLTVDFKDNKVTTYVPKEMALEWTTTDKVGFTNNSPEIAILVEKDFTCLENVDEDQSDNYPNPLLKKN